MAKIPGSEHGLQCMIVNDYGNSRSYSLTDLRPRLSLPSNLEKNKTKTLKVD